nr:GntR family transcriptional regulator [Maliibacterium massiliense]
MKQTNVSLSNQAYQAIKTMVITKKLEVGTLITEPQLQEILGIGRTPVHEACLKLACEQLIKIVPRRGIEVMQISPKMVNDIFNARKLIEPTVLPHSYEKIDVDWLADMRRQFQTIFDKKLTRDNEDLYAYLQRDITFHSTLVRSLGNTYINNMVDTYFNQMLVIGMAVTPKSSRGGNSIRDHIVIIDHILDKNVAAACDVLLQHIELSHKDVINNYIRT